MNYTVKYKKFHWLFWRTIKNVANDGFVDGYIIDNPMAPPGTPSFRYFTQENGIRYEIPIKNMVFVFTSNREEILKKQNEKRTKQQAEELARRKLENN